MKVVVLTSTLTNSLSEGWVRNVKCAESLRVCPALVDVLSYMSILDGNYEKKPGSTIEIYEGFFENLCALSISRRI